jgi:hypothetical protein
MANKGRKVKEIKNKVEYIVREWKASKQASFRAVYQYISIKWRA